jgi:hypothetical protein
MMFMPERYGALAGASINEPSDGKWREMLPAGYPDIAKGVHACQLKAD